MMANLKEIAKLQKEAVELLKEAKTEDAIAKMEASADLIAKEAEKEETEVSKIKEVDIKKTFEVEFKKFADMYLNGDDVKDIFKQIIEASELAKQVETISKELEEIKKTETNSKQIEEITKTDDEYSVWAWL